MDSDVIVAAFIVIGALVGIGVWFRMLWRNWTSGNKDFVGEEVASEPFDVLIDDTDCACGHHHSHGGFHSGHSDLGSDPGLGHFDGGHHH